MSHGHSGHLTQQEKISANPKTLWRMIKLLTRYKKALIIAFTANIAVTILTIYSMQWVGQAVDRYITHFNANGLAQFSLLLLALFAFTSCASYLETRIMAEIAQRLAYRLRESIYTKMIALPMAYFDQHTVGDMMSRMTNDVDNVNNTLADSVNSFLESTVNLIGMLIAMALLSIRLTLWTLIILPITLLSTRIVLHFSRQYFTKQQKQLGQLNGYIEEIISAQKMLLLYKNAPHIDTKFDDYNRLLAQASEKAQTLSAIMPLINFINNLAYLMVTFIGASYIMQGNGLTIGALFTFLLFMRRFARPLNTIAGLLNTIQSALAGADRIFELLDEPLEKDKDLSPYQYHGGKIAFEHVFFSYDKDQPILHDINFSLAPGETVALVGATGSGKTTLSSLLNRFYDPDQGRILLDDQDTKTLTHESIRQHIGLVLQETFLFNDTLRNNIRYARPDASDEDVERAAQIAGADSFVKQLPNGYNTQLTDNGENFSQGQRQLIAISRAVLANTPILILDEATSSIDTRTEQLVQEGLKRLTHNRTTFIIAHRLSTIQRADHILVMQHGRIIEQGNHEQLLAFQGTYATMHAVNA